MVYRVPVRWTWRAAKSPSSLWSWGHGTWSPLTSTRTVATRPPSSPAPAPPPSRWSLTTAVKRRRGEYWCQTFNINIQRYFFIAGDFKCTYVKPPLLLSQIPLQYMHSIWRIKAFLTLIHCCLDYSKIWLPGVYRRQRWEGPVWHEGWDGEVAKGRIWATFNPLRCTITWV